MGLATMCLVPLNVLTIRVTCPVYPPFFCTGTGTELLFPSPTAAEMSTNLDLRALLLDPFDADTGKTIRQAIYGQQSPQ